MRQRDVVRVCGETDTSTNMALKRVESVLLEHPPARINAERKQIDRMKERERKRKREREAATMLRLHRSATVNSRAVLPFDLRHSCYSSSRHRYC